MWPSFPRGRLGGLLTGPPSIPLRRHLKVHPDHLVSWPADSEEGQSARGPARLGISTSAVGELVSGVGTSVASQATIYCVDSAVAPLPPCIPRVHPASPTPCPALPEASTQPQACALCAGLPAQGSPHFPFILCKPGPWGLNS